MMQMTYETYTKMHEARHEVHFKAWEAARDLPKADRKVERAMCAMATKLAREILEEMFFPNEDWKA